MTEQQIIETLATKVMGWKVDGSKLIQNGYVSYLIEWNPLKYMDDAWMIAEKLYIGVHPQSPGSPEDMRFLAVFETHSYERGIEAYGKTAQEAICKAALEAVA
ncbi:BC1872 family protein [Brevibacillus formosus]|uniref:BC1872 family protein n=1 Tax=Brevibacillus formosus TaxID=54913 RepID=UPI003F1D63B3